ncbi:MAG: tetratricopeptide repeat protein, partial [Planctomycetota bacterium]|nr:tetratricopeptide repeat protein [Planctomycetota bacterium]
MRPDLSVHRVGALNVKLLLILSIVGMSLVGGLGGAYYFLVLRSASSIYEKAVEFEKAEKFRDARRNYQRALGKEARDLNYLTSLQRVILLTSPNSTVEANEFYSAWLATLEWGAENHPDLPERSQIFVRTVYADAMDVQSASLMEKVEDAADAAGIRNPENESFSERWIAASRLNKIRWGDLRDRDRDDAFDLLQNRLDDNPQAIDFAIALRGYAIRLEDAVLDNDRSLIREYAQTLRSLFEKSSEVEVPAAGTEPALLSSARALVGDEFVSPLPEDAVGHTRALWTIGRLEAAQALNNERVLEILPEVKVEDGPLRDFALGELPRMIELFNVSDCLEVLSRMGEPNLLSQTKAALSNLQATSYSDYVIEHRRIQLLSQSPEEDDRALALELAKGFTQRSRPTVGLYTGGFDGLKLSIYGIRTGLVMDQLVRGQLDREDAIDSIDELYDEASVLVPEPEDDLTLLEIQAKRAYAEGGNRSLRTAARLLDDILRRKSLSGQPADVRLLLYSVQVNRELNQLGLALSQLDQALESVPNEPTLLQNKLQILVLKRDWEQVLMLGQAMMDAEINFEASANAVQMAQDALEGKVRTSPLALEVQSILQRYDDGEREESLREMKAVYERESQEFIVVISYVRMLIVEEQKPLALEILNAFDTSNPRVKESIRELRVTASTSDPIDAIVLFHSDEVEARPATGAVLILRDLVSLQANADRSGDLELVDRVEKEISARELDAAKNYSEDPDWIEFRFSRALVSEDWSAALDAAQFAERLNVDQASGKTYQGRLAMAQREWATARDAFASAVEAIPTDGRLLAQLAQSEAQLGDYTNAERHFVEAWEIQPNSVSIARGYATLLVQIGKKQAAAEVLQSASRFAPNNIALREAWLNLALEGADLSGLLQIRLSRYASNPEDVRNVIELALLLGVAEPTVGTIRILDPKFSYNQNQFNQLPAERQNALIESNRQAWWKQSDELLDEVLQADDPEFDALVVGAYKAEISKRQGRSELGIAALRELVSSSTEDQRTLKANLLLSNLFSELGRTDESIAVLEPLNEISATFAAASIYMSKNQFAKAADQYEMLVAKLPEASEASTVRVFGPDPSRPGLVETVLPRHAFFEQYSECLARSDRPAEAQAIFDGLPLPQDDRDKAARALIQSMIYAGYASKKYSENQDGSLDEASALQELKLAKQLLPRDIGSRLLEASIFTERFRRTGDKEAYEAAVKSLTDAESLSPQSAAVAAARFALLDAGGDVSEGIRALQTQLDLDPTNNKLRLRIVREYVSLGDRVSAALVAGEGGRSLPTGTLSAQWFARAGELLIGIPDQELQARDYFRKAFDQDPNSMTFARRMASEVSVPTPDWRLVVQLTAKEEAWVQDNPDLLSVRATALLNVGREQESRTVLRECFSAFQRQVAKGTPKLMISRYPLQLQAYFGDDRVEEVKRFAEEANGGALSWPLLNGLARVKLNSGDLEGAVEDAKKSAEMATEQADPEAAEVWLVAGNIAIAAN